MRFHLNYIPKPSAHRINHHHKLMLMGSCFAENISKKLTDSGFNVDTNPNGILFNPGSICRCISDMIESRETEDAVFVKKNDIYVSFNHHGSIFGNTKEELKRLLNDIREKESGFLKTADHLIVTFGTAFVYRHIQHKIIVANCHKQPNNHFDKQLLSVHDIVKDYAELINKLKSFNPKLKIIFTVSPVKYLKDGLEENSISKATLLLAVHQLKKEYNIDYFPAFELVNDDLRDYRFYKEDLVHPNDMAIQYVWEKFSDVYFTDETKKINTEIYSIINAEKHNLLFPESEEAKKFKTQLEKRKMEIKNKFPFLTV